VAGDVAGAGRLVNTPVFRGAVSDDGKRLTWEARRLLIAWMAQHPGHGFALTPVKAAKSPEQLGYWHGVLIPLLAEELGYGRWEHDAVHDAVMRKLRGEHGPLKARLSMSKMTQPEVSALIEDCRTWALLDLGIVTPDAEPDSSKRKRTKEAA